MPQTYTTVAREIIQDAIRSVIFVDDELAVPFDSTATERQIALSKELYNSFTTTGSTADFYRYRPDGSWTERQDYLFKGRDLLVIDWQLDADPQEHRTTLKILQQAVNRPSLHFICIYTNTEPSGFNDVLYQIAAYFRVADERRAQAALTILKETINDEDVFDELFTPTLLGLLKELVLFPDRTKLIMADIRGRLTNKLSEEKMIELHRKLKQHYSSIEHAIAALGAVQNDVPLGSEGNECDVVVHTANHFVRVNHTVILLMNKMQVEPSALYERFSDAVINSSGNFLTLLSLEMRNLYRAGSSFIGKDIDSINELAFLYHQGQSQPPEAFNDFLSDLWKNQSLGFLYDKATQSRLLDSLPNYIQEKGLIDKIAAYPQRDEARQDTSRLNYYYNILKTNRAANDTIRFGDIFRLRRADGRWMDKYLLCITAHCDCLRPEKVRHMLYFVAGVPFKLKDALAAGDTGHQSFIEAEGKAMAIDWLEKPFTLYIAPAKNNIGSAIKVSWEDEEAELIYQATIKENYAQRMANRAASYPLRVGIYFAGFKSAADTAEPAG